MTWLKWGELFQDLSGAFNTGSMAAGAVSAIGTISAPNVAMGDFVEASFSADRQGVALDAWVSQASSGTTPGTISFIFHNRTAAAITLNGTVYVRPKKRT
jgi:hypothetical protein